MSNSDFAVQRVAMVDGQVRPADVTRFPIISAMLDCPREAFVPDSLRSVAYLGDHLPLTEDRVLLDPRVFAKMLNEVDIRGDEFVLDIGCGYGYSSAVIARIAEAVVALEEDQKMAQVAAHNLVEQSVDNTVAVEGALCEGVPQHAPYDVIVVQGGVGMLPDAISEQLRDGGRIVCIFASRIPGECRLGIKQGEHVSWRMAFNASAPLLTGFAATKDFVF